MLDQATLLEIVAAMKPVVREAAADAVADYRRSVQQAAKRARRQPRPDPQNPIKSEYSRRRGRQPESQKRDDVELDLRIERIERYQKERRGILSSEAAEYAFQVCQQQRSAGEKVAFRDVHARILAELEAAPDKARKRYSKERETAQRSRYSFTPPANGRPATYQSPRTLAGLLAQQRTGKSEGAAYNAEVQAILREFADGFNRKLDGNRFVALYASQPAEQETVKALYSSLATQISDLAIEKSKASGRSFTQCHLEASQEVMRRHMASISDQQFVGGDSGSKDWTRRPLISR